MGAITGPAKSNKGTVIFLHGAPTQSYSYRVVLAQMAKAGYHCYAPDWLGFGFSEKPQPDYDFSYTGTYYYFPTIEYSVALSLNICLLKLIAWLCGDRTLLG
jgi:pimeloyl-ACP methyl ester carboxylesterase